MTGYTSIVSEFILDREGNYIRPKELKNVHLVVYDAWRINQTGDYYMFIGDENSQINEPIMSCKLRWMLRIIGTDLSVRL